MRPGVLVAVAIGFVLMQWALVCLGRQFSVEVTIQKDHRLVTDGIYRYLRHPRYLRSFLFFGGLSCVFRSGLALLLAVALVGALLWRIHDEEALVRGKVAASTQKPGVRCYSSIGKSFTKTSSIGLFAQQSRRNCSLLPPRHSTGLEPLGLPTCSRDILEAS